jgi:WhiB family redox-sensing transcriptional regulator
MADAACRDNDVLPPDAWFSVDEDRGGMSWEMHQAVAICNRCPVMDECADYGIRHREAGIWGGLSADRRRQVARRRGITQIVVTGPTGTDPGACGTRAGARRHHRKGEKPCPSCLEAARVYYTERHNRKAWR